MPDLTYQSIGYVFNVDTKSATKNLNRLEKSYSSLNKQFITTSRGFQSNTSFVDKSLTRLINGFQKSSESTDKYNKTLEDFRDISRKAFEKNRTLKVKTFSVSPGKDVRGGMPQKMQIPSFADDMGSIIKTTLAQLHKGDVVGPMDDFIKLIKQAVTPELKKYNAKEWAMYGPELIKQQLTKNLKVKLGLDEHGMEALEMLFEGLNKGELDVLRDNKALSKSYGILGEQLDTFVKAGRKAEDALEDGSGASVFLSKMFGKKLPIALNTTTSALKQTAAAFGLIKVFGETAEFEQNLMEVQRVAKLTQGEVWDLFETVNDLSVNTLASSQEVVKVLALLRSRGYKAGDAMNSLASTTLKYSEVMGTSVDATAELFAKLNSNRYGYSEKGIQGIASQMKYLADNTYNGIEAIPKFLEEMEPLVATKIPKDIRTKLLPQLVALGGVSEGVWGDSQALMNSVMGMFDYTNEQGQQFKNTLMAWGGLTQEQFMAFKKTGDISNIWGSIYKTAKSLPEDQLVEFSASMEAATGQSSEFWMALKNLNSEAEFNDLIKGMDKAGKNEEYLNERFNDLRSSFNGLKQQLSLIGKAFITTLGQPLLWIVKAVLLPFVGLIKSIGWVFTKLPGPMKKVISTLISLTVTLLILRKVIGTLKKTGLVQSMFGIGTEGGGIKIRGLLTGMKDFVKTIKSGGFINALKVLIGWKTSQEVLSKTAGGIAGGVAGDVGSTVAGEVITGPKGKSFFKRLGQRMRIFWKMSKRMVGTIFGKEGLFAAILGKFSLGGIGTWFKGLKIGRFFSVLKRPFAGLFENLFGWIGKRSVGGMLANLGKGLLKKAGVVGLVLTAFTIGTKIGKALGNAIKFQIGKDKVSLHNVAEMAWQPLADKVMGVGKAEKVAAEQAAKLQKKYEDKYGVKFANPEAFDLFMKNRKAILANKDTWAKIAADTRIERNEILQALSGKPMGGPAKPGAPAIRTGAGGAPLPGTPLAQANITAMPPQAVITQGAIVAPGAGIPTPEQAKTAAAEAKLESKNPVVAAIIWNAHYIGDIIQSTMNRGAIAGKGGAAANPPAKANYTEPMPTDIVSPQTMGFNM